MEQKKLKKIKKIAIISNLPQNYFLKKHVFNPFLTNKMYTVFMLNCEKHNIEKKMVRFLKLLYFKCTKNIKKVLKYTIIHSSSILCMKLSKNNRKDIPFFFKKSLRKNFAIKTIKKVVLKNKSESFIESFHKETINILKKSSVVLTLKETLLKESLKKKSNAHFRWF